MKALVLSGGGSKGAYQIGVWKALKKLHIKYDIVTGTSVGALNGALFTQNSYFKAYLLWKKINMKTLFGDEAVESFDDKKVFKMYRDNFFKNGGMEVTKLQNLIDKVLNKKKFYNSKINFGLVTYNISKNKPIEITKKDIKKEELSDYLLASASCYPAFQPKNIDGKKYIDGGFFDNMPINLALNMGADEIIAVNLEAPGINKTPKKKVPTITIKPNNKLSNFLNFNEEGAKRNIKLGYNDTMKVFHKLDGKKYTFKKNTISKINKKYTDFYIEKFYEIINTPNLIEKFIKSKLFTEKNMEKLLLKSIENLASNFNLDETKIYSYKKFNKILLKEVNVTIDISKYSLLSKLVKSKAIVLEIYKKLLDNDIKALRKDIIIYPNDFLEALYLYTIKEC